MMDQFLQMHRYFRFCSDPFEDKIKSQLIFRHPGLEVIFNTLYGFVIEHSGLVVVTGEHGIGKTVLMQRLRDQLVLDDCLVFPSSYPRLLPIQTALSIDGLLSLCCQDVGLLDQGWSREQRLRALVEALTARVEAGGTVVLLIDDAQDLPETVLAHLHLLSGLKHRNRPLLQVVLAGTPDIEMILRPAGRLPVAQIVAARLRLVRLDRRDIGPYINHRLRTAGYLGDRLFSPEAVERVADHSDGIPLRINRLCEAALLMVCARSGDRVTAEMIDQAAKDIEQTAGGAARTLAAASAGGETAEASIAAQPAAPSAVVSLPVATVPDGREDDPAAGSRRADGDRQPGGAGPPLPPGLSMPSDHPNDQLPDDIDLPEDIDETEALRPERSRWSRYGGALLAAGLGIAGIAVVASLEMLGEEVVGRPDPLAAYNDLGPTTAGPGARDRPPQSATSLPSPVAGLPAENPTAAWRLADGTPAATPAPASPEQDLGTGAAAPAAPEAAAPAPPEAAPPRAPPPEAASPEAVPVSTGGMADAAAPAPPAQAAAPPDLPAADRAATEGVPAASAPDTAPDATPDDAGRTRGAPAEPLRPPAVAGRSGGPQEDTDREPPPLAVMPDPAAAPTERSPAGPAADGAVAQHPPVPNPTPDAAVSTMSAAAEPQPKAPAAPSPALDRMIARGNDLLAAGDVIAARLLYERAAAQGSPRAMTMAGRTYDPLFFREATVRGLQADPAEAIRWYRRASDAGDPEAALRLNRLADWLQGGSR